MDLEEHLRQVVERREAKKAGRPPVRTVVDYAAISARAVKRATEKRPTPSGVLTRDNPLLTLLQNSSENRNPRAWADVKRIIEVEIAYPITLDEHADVQARWVLGGATMGGKPFVLKEQQAHTVLMWERHRGVFAKIGVGKGKTIATLILAQSAWDMGIKKIMLNVPAHVYAQLTLKDIPQARKLIRLNLPIHKLGDATKTKRLALAHSGYSGLYIYPYSTMSGRTAHEEIWAIKPQLIISDECQNVAAQRSARGKRYTKYCREHRPYVCVLSGTITKKSVREYQHLVGFALRDNSFLPHSPQVAAEWGSILDSTGYVDNESASGPLRPIIDWAVENFPDEDMPLDQSGFRKAFRLRMEHTPGVVSSGDEDIGTSLVIVNDPVELAGEGHHELERLMSMVKDEWTTPNGDEIEHAIHTFKWLFELSAGFYNNLVWPEPEALALRKGIDVEDAQVLLDRALVLHAAKQEYARCLRRWLADHHIPGMDTPFLVGGDMARNAFKNVGYDLYTVWQMAKELEDPELPERDSFPVRVCPYKINAAVEWSKDGKRKEGGILWYYHQEVGKWLVEALRAAGLDPLWCPAGKKHNISILDSHGRLVVASIKAHGVGKNLQMHSEQRCVQWCRGADIAEQKIGRTHRLGQEVDTLKVTTTNSLPWDHDSFAATLNDALYIHQTTQEQKLIIAGYDPVPEVMPWEVLKERGFQPSELSPEMASMMVDKFGT